MYTVAYEHADRAHYEWTELAEETEAAPFLHPGWFEAWRAAFGDRGFRLLTARHGDRLVAALPVETARAGVLRSPTGLDTPRYGTLASNPLAALALGRFLTEEAPRRVDLAYMSE